MRRRVELCLVVLAATSGIVLFGGGAPSGISPLSVLEARTVIGGGTTLESSCAGNVLSVEEPPGTGCSGTCLRIPSVYSTEEQGTQVPKTIDCPNRCGRFAVAATPCGA